MPATDPFTALSMSASSNTMKGDLPPSSRLTSAKFSAELRTTWRAAAGPPVKAMRATKGCLVSASPQAAPPGTYTTRIFTGSGAGGFRTLTLTVPQTPVIRTPTDRFSGESMDWIISAGPTSA